MPTLAASTGSTIGIALALIFVLGVGAQWLAWKIRVPSILLLLLIGILAGPVARTLLKDTAFYDLALNPNELFGTDVLLAAVGIAVGLILYEGGLTLNFKELRSTWKPVTLLVSVGAFVTWIVAGFSAYYIFDLDRSIAILLGAILIVTGPTVVGPLLNHIRPSGDSGLVLKWEGIVIDPIGVLAAVLVFEVIAAQASVDISAQAAEMSEVQFVLVAIAKTIIAGFGFGMLAAILLRTVMNRFLVPDYLQNPVSLMLVIGAFTASNQVMPESGLLATTVMGIALGNQKKVDVHHILEFKENLRVLLIGALFIVLSARLEVSQLQQLDWLRVLVFLAVLILIARPAAVFIATIGAGMSLNERMFIAWLAPRGIVAAAGASIFSLGLGTEDAEQIVPLTFSVIIGTVAFYGLTAPWAAKMLKVADQNPQGILFIGAPKWARAIAQTMHERGFKVLMIDANRANVRLARMEGLNAIQENILTIPDITDLDLRGIGRVFACTPNDEVNTLSLQRFMGYFETSKLYQVLPVKTKKGHEDTHHPDRRWRTLFDHEAEYANLEHALEHGGVIKATSISDEFTYSSYMTLYGTSIIPLFTLKPSGTIVVWTGDKPAEPVSGDTMIAIVNPDELFVGGPFLGEATQDADSEPSAEAAS
jgi:NhaP-type Na+/H+ or K+/H+ antiporter